MREFHGHGPITNAQRTRRWRVAHSGRRVIGATMYLRRPHFSSVNIVIDAPSFFARGIVLSMAPKDRGFGAWATRIFMEEGGPAGPSSKAHQDVSERRKLIGGLFGG